MARALDKGFWGDQSGAVAATYALAIIPLVAIIGLAFDYARVVGMDSELQAAADQAALAGATQLTRSAGSMELAIAAIQGGLVTNSTLLSNDGAGGTVAITDADVQIVFYNTKADAENGTNPILSTETGRFSEAGFVGVTVDVRTANYAFTPIVGAISGDLAASAVAGVGSALCRIPPLMICNPDEDPNETNSDFNAASRVGYGLLAKPGGGSQWTPGNYGYLDLGANGAVGVRQALGWDGPPGQCLSQSGVDTDEPAEVDTQTGNIASGPQAINTRFDIYEAQGCVNGGTCSPALNSRKDMMRAVDATPATGNSCSIHNSGWQNPTNPYYPTDATVDYVAPIGSMGHPRDKCHAVRDGDPGNCRNDAFGDGNWDRAAYFATHFPIGFNPGVIPKAGAQLTRHEVYTWEETNQNTALLDTPAGATGSDLTTRNRPVCGPAYGWNAATAPIDRRRMTVAVINCEQHDVKGNSKDVPVRRWVDVFLVQPSVDRGPGNNYTRKDEIYVEIISETDISRAGAPVGPTIRRDVPYLVK